jgi:hypothetical protein
MEEATGRKTTNRHCRRVKMMTDVESMNNRRRRSAHVGHVDDVVEQSDSKEHSVVPSRLKIV